MEKNQTILDGIDPAERVRHKRAREDPHLRREQRVERRESEAALGVRPHDWDIAQRGAGGFRDLLPRYEIGMVLHLGRENHITGLQT